MRELLLNRRSRKRALSLVAVGHIAFNVNAVIYRTIFIQNVAMFAIVGVGVSVTKF